MKSQEFSNVRALQIFKRKVLLSIVNSTKIFERDFFRQIASQHENLGFSETDKFSSDYSLNTCFLRRFPYINDPSFSPYKPLQNVHF